MPNDDLGHQHVTPPRPDEGREACDVSQLTVGIQRQRDQGWFPRCWSVCVHASPIACQACESAKESDWQILTEPFHRNCAGHEGHGRLLAE
jgi:hypothetical protein